MGHSSLEEAADTLLFLYRPRQAMSLTSLLLLHDVNGQHMLHMHPDSALEKKQDQQAVG